MLMNNLLRMFKDDDIETEFIVNTLGEYSNCVDCLVDFVCTENCPACDLKYLNDYNRLINSKM